MSLSGSFLLLLGLGYRQSMPRRVRPGASLAMALGMFGLSLYGIATAFGAAPLALLAWAAGYALAAMAGARLRAASGMVAAGSSVRMPGSWVPMALMLGIFAAKFALGFAAGVRSPLLHEPWFVAAMGAVLGALSGGFAARAVAVYRAAGSLRAARQDRRSMDDHRGNAAAGGKAAGPNQPDGPAWQTLAARGARRTGR